MAGSRIKRIAVPDQVDARTYCKLHFPSAFVRKKKGVNGVWEFFAKPKAQMPLTYGFSIAEAYQEAALLAGWSS